MKNFTAVLAAFGITAIIGLAMLIIGGNALFNPYGVQASTAPGSSTTNSTALASQNGAVGQAVGSSAQIQQLQDQLNQAQAQLDAANQQISQDQQVLSQYQLLFRELQRRGIIVVGQDGGIFIRGGG